MKNHKNTKHPWNHKKSSNKIFKLLLRVSNCLTPRINQFPHWNNLIFLKVWALHLSNFFKVRKTSFQKINSTSLLIKFHLTASARSTATLKIKMMTLWVFKTALKRSRKENNKLTLIQVWQNFKTYPAFSIPLLKEIEKAVKLGLLFFKLYLFLIFDFVYFLLISFIYFLSS